MGFFIYIKGFFKFFGSLFQPIHLRFLIKTKKIKNSQNKVSSYTPPKTMKKNMVYKLPP